MTAGRRSEGKKSIFWIVALACLALGLLFAFFIPSAFVPPEECLSNAISTAEGVEVRFIHADDSGFHVLSASEWSELQALLQDHYLTTEMNVMCHEPDIEIRFVRNWGRSLTGTLSFECNNFYFDNMLGQTEWVSVFERNGAQSGLPDLAEFFTRLEHR